MAVPLSILTADQRTNPLYPLFKIPQLTEEPAQTVFTGGTGATEPHAGGRDDCACRNPPFLRASCEFRDLRKLRNHALLKRA